MLLCEEVGFDYVPAAVARAIINGDHEKFAVNFVELLAGGGKFIPTDLEVRTAPFDPAEFIGPGWTLWKGRNGLEGEEECDAQSPNLVAVNLERCDFLSCLDKEESPITGEVRLSRFRATGRILYGVTVAMGIWQDYQSSEDKEESILEKLYQKYGITHIDFLGTVLRSPGGYRYVFCFCRGADDQWRWGCNGLMCDCAKQHLAAVSQKI
ncbi:MAG: hypothetical protein WC845_02395 [Candidatus Staskawiczbacteria bacterium]|jgi:hypothetical protein